jgi:hypothetical protein
MHQSIVKFIALLHICCSTCFGHYNAHHQEPAKLPLQPLVSYYHKDSVVVNSQMIKYKSFIYKILFS